MCLFCCYLQEKAQAQAFANALATIGKFALKKKAGDKDQLFGRYVSCQTWFRCCYVRADVDYGASAVCLVSVYSLAWISVRAQWENSW